MLRLLVQISLLESKLWTLFEVWFKGCDLHLGGLISIFNLIQLLYMCSYTQITFIHIDGYLEYFMAPYFIFVRDSLSYLALLGLHFFICLSPSRIRFSEAEWGIFIFFLGRIVMETKQLLRAKQCVRGSEYTSCEDTEEDDDTGIKRRQKDGAVVKTLNNYIR